MDTYVDKHLFLEIDSGGSRWGPVGSGGVFSQYASLPRQMFTATEADGTGETD